MHTEDKQYWRSFANLQGSPEFKEWVHREFQENAPEAPQGPSRRNMLMVMAASFGLAGMTACRRPEQKILPNAMGVEDYMPGEPLVYSTAMPMGGVAQGLNVRVNDGRPTKVDGNPDHPFSLGAATAFQQASVLSVYDPDRSKSVLKGGAESSWDDFTDFAKRQAASAGSGAGLRFLSERASSPSLMAVKAAALKKYPQAKWVEYEALGPDASLEGMQIAFGQSVAPVYHYDKADVVVSLDSDFLGMDSLTVQPTKSFSRKRKVEDPQGEHARLYVVESQFSVTGATADHRLRMRSADIPQFAVRLANELGAFGSALKSAQPVQGPAEKFALAVAKDLQRTKGRCVVVVGPRQPAEVHALGFVLNQALGNVGQTVTYYKLPENPQPQGPGLKDLVGEMSAGKVTTLVILGTNPAFTAPDDLKFADAMKKVANTIHLGCETDETAALSAWHIPEAHYLESWSDARSVDGTASVIQPMIQPLYGGKTAAEVVAVLTGYSAENAYDIVRGTWLSTFPKADSEKAWRTALHSGLLKDTAYPVASVSPDSKKVGAAVEALAAQGSGLELVFVPSFHTYDGRFANNAWLQEAPHPMTRLVWDNAALISPATAKSLGIDPTSDERGVMLNIERNGQRVVMPCIVLPGHADNSVTLAVGHGRSEIGAMSRGRGFNVYPLRTSDATTVALGATVKVSGEPKYILAVTQDHHSMEGRPMVREAALDKYKEEPQVIAEQAETPPLFSLFDEFAYKKGQQWGMTIDLTACTGCGACVLACQAENNVPVVGKAEVLRGREMHWIRTDRYFTGDPENARAVVQPVPCMHCEDAPCEAVCPVAATIHSPEGLNDMAYNRCVGTRYCSNNCPYKVRRFNFFNWHKHEQEPTGMVYNPDVTVRMRGVMEKCTYCVQRIERTRIAAHAGWRNGTRDTDAIKDGELVTACQQTCPADAIVFGNINDPSSRVAQLKKQKRNYGMLEELNTRPRTTYLARLRNETPELSA